MYKSVLEHLQFIQTSHEHNSLENTNSLTKPKQKPVRCEHKWAEWKAYRCILRTGKYTKLHRTRNGGICCYSSNDCLYNNKVYYNPTWWCVALRFCCYCNKHERKENSALEYISDP